MVAAAAKGIKFLFKTFLFPSHDRFRLLWHSVDMCVIMPRGEQPSRDSTEYYHIRWGLLCNGRTSTRAQGKPSVLPLHEIAVDA